MRTIKFRAWDKKNKKMFRVVAIDWHTMEIIDPEIMQHKINFTPLMQFTGLLDKNGKEIYEGDLFKCIYHRDGHTDHIYEVIWNEFSAAFEFQRHGNPCPQREVSQYPSDVSKQWREIIGNIYENPELLENK